MFHCTVTSSIYIQVPCPGRVWSSGAFTWIFQGDSQVTACSLQVVECLVFDADSFAEYFFRSKTAFCNLRICLVCRLRRTTNPAGDMCAHSVIGDATDCYFIHCLRFSQVDRKGCIFVVPAAPFEVGLFVAAP